MSAWTEFIKEKAPEQGKSEEDFDRDFRYQAEMFLQAIGDAVHSIPREKLDEMYAEWIQDDGMDHADMETDAPSKLVWAWHKEQGLPRRGSLSDG